MKKIEKNAPSRLNTARLDRSDFEEATRFDTGLSITGLRCSSTNYVKPSDFMEGLAEEIGYQAITYSDYTTALSGLLRDGATRIESRLECQHGETGHWLKVSSARASRDDHNNSLCVAFDCRDYTALSYETVQRLEGFLLDNHDIELCPSEITVNLIIRAKEGVNLHGLVCGSIRVGDSGLPNMDGSLHEFECPRLGVRVVVQDITSWFRRLNYFLEQSVRLSLPGDVVRIKFDIDLTKSNGLPQRLKNLAYHNWEMLYPTYFSFHWPNEDLRGKLGDKVSYLPMWELQETLCGEHSIEPSDFYRHFTLDFDALSLQVREYLSRRWIDY